MLSLCGPSLTQIIDHVSQCIMLTCLYHAQLHCPCRTFRERVSGCTRSFNVVITRFVSCCVPMNRHRMHCSLFRGPLSHSAEAKKDVVNECELALGTSPGSERALGIAQAAVRVVLRIRTTECSCRSAFAPPNSFKQGS